MKRVYSLLLSAVLLAGTTWVAAQEYPSKPVRLIVPFAPGGGNDIVARAIAQQLSASLGRQFVVDNRAGAGGVVGAELAAKSPADGYTLFHGGGESQSRQAELRLQRQRQLGAARRRALRIDGRRADGARSLQGARAGAGRSPERRSTVDVQQHGRDHSPYQDGQAARAGGHGKEALAPAAGGADARRIGPARLRSGILVRDPRAGRHAAADRRQAERRDRPGPAAARDPRAPCRRGRRSDRRHAWRIRRAHQCRAGPRRQDPARRRRAPRVAAMYTRDMARFISGLQYAS